MDGKRMALAASALVLLVACSSGFSSGDGGGGGAVGAPQGGPDLAEVPSVEGVGAAAIPLPGVRPTVIKTATLRIEVDPGAAAQAMSAATRAAGRYGGFILHSEAVEAGRATLVIRVPSRQYESALADIRALGDVERSVVDGQDVGEEFVDLEARLRNLQAEQAVMLRLFDQAATIPDTIRVQEEVSAVQLEIERIRGRLRFLRDQTAFGTITVTFVERGVEEGVGIIERSWNQAVDGLVAVAAGAITVVGYLIPVAVLGLIVTAIAWVVLRKMWPRLGVRSP
jgi:Ca-activated chloride channel family protein